MSYIEPAMYRYFLENVTNVCVDILLKHRGLFVLLKRSEEPCKDLYWPIGGRIHKGETAEQAARRKIKEEIGIDYTDIGSKNMSAIYTKAGVPSGLGNFKESLLEKMTKLGTLPLVHQPGEKFTYGLNSDLLGCIVEIVSGTTLENYFQKNIFDPLGMKDTYFNVPASKANRMPTVYTENEAKQIIEWSPTFRNLNPNYPLVPKTYFSGGAGLSSTAYDYAIFLQMILR